MEDIIALFEQRSSGQKILIAGGIVVLLLFFITLMFVVTTPKQNKSDIAPESTPTAADSGKKLSDLPSSSPTPVANLYTYAGNHFQVTYDGNIYSASGNKNNGGDNILLEHKGLPNFLINFMIASSSSVPVQGIYNVFGAFKYPINSITFNGIPAVRFVGSIKSGSQTFTDDAIVFTKNNLTYKFQLTYKENNNSEIESAFNQILSTVRIN